MNTLPHAPWPDFSYEKFKSTGYLLHRIAQVIGKLKLITPYEPHWANIGLWVTTRGLSTGPIPYDVGTFSIDIDLIAHQIIAARSQGDVNKLAIHSCSVADFTQSFFMMLNSMGIQLTINPMPQEVTNPIPFHKDTGIRTYDAELANAWWHIIANSQQVIQKYHALFTGCTPAIAFMWGTFDLRDVRYLNNKPVKLKPGTNFIERNAMDVAQIESGFWHGNENYPKPAFYSFTWPKPDGIENANIEPNKAYWNKALSEFILDYDEIRTSSHPEKDLLAFFNSTYKVGSELAGWDPNLVSSGKPI